MGPVAALLAERTSLRVSCLDRLFVQGYLHRACRIACTRNLSEGIDRATRRNQRQRPTTRIRVYGTGSLPSLVNVETRKFNPPHRPDKAEQATIHHEPRSNRTEPSPTKQIQRPRQSHASAQTVRQRRTHRRARDHFRTPRSSRSRAAQPKKPPGRSISKPKQPIMLTPVDL